LDVTKSHVGELLAVPALAAAGVLWGVSFLFGKWALEEMGPAHLTLLRFALASAALLPYALLKGVWPTASVIMVEPVCRRREVSRDYGFCGLH
jgi:drug/metabolite transporter (DMT)-like permease